MTAWRLTPGTASELSTPEAVAERRRRLGELHVAPLAELAAALSRDGPVPMPDPSDGGVEATMLFLLEKPGAGAATGFVSRDNPSGTSRALRAMTAAAGIDRAATLLWNAVPWWNGTPVVRRAELARGAQALGALLPLMPRLAVVVTLGRTAERAWRLGGIAGLPAVACAHPSPQVRAAFPERWAAIPSAFAEAARIARTRQPRRRPS
ncbi:uracil-DNA glycosylase [Acuticoccus sp.]|uniref:uracil-DNA glycosylase n=1 Tax=Acuticoccus sp. TaxID=1904378 RepID=UPI003B52A6A4